MNLDNITNKIIIAVIFLLTTIRNALPTALSTEMLRGCVYWNSQELHRCYPGTHMCDGDSCCPCPVGTFMSWNNDCPQCLPLRDCDGKIVLYNGDSGNDRVCGDYPSSTAEPSHLTKSTTLPQSSSRSVQDESTTEKEGLDDPGEPSDDLDEGTPVTKFDLHTAELVVIVLLTAVIAAMVGERLYRWRCPKQKRCKCQCEPCKGCTMSARRRSEGILPLHKDETDALNGIEIIKMKTDQSFKNKKKKSARGRKRSTPIIPNPDRV